MIQCFPKPYDRFRGNFIVELDLSHYATKTDYKEATGTYTSNLALKQKLASLKAEIGKIDKEKLNTD